MGGKDRKRRKKRTHRAKRPSKSRSMLSRSPIHTFLFPPFFVLSLYTSNIQELPFKVVLIPGVIAIGGALILWGLLTLAMKSGRKSAVVTSMTVVLFFSFGHIRNVVPQFEFTLLGLDIGRRFLLISVSLVVLILAGFGIAKSKWSWGVPTTLLNLLAIFLIAVVGLQIAYHVVSNIGAGGPAAEMLATDNAPPVTLEDGRELPNIYYIVMDGYARNDVLKEWYGYDNQPFLDYLAAKKFFIANKAKSNYCQTGLSLSSTLNMGYLTNVSEKDKHTNTRVPLIKSFYANAVCRKLRKLGYQIVCYSSGYYMTAEIEGAIYPKAELLDEFQRGLLETTPLASETKGSRDGRNPFEAHRRRILYTLDHLGDVYDPDRPVFVFAHVVSPHPPFVFDASGNPKEVITPFQHSDGSDWFASGEGTVRDYRERYVDQLKFMNTKLERAIDTILARSTRPTIIILQGDHGPGSMLDWESTVNTNMTERLSILSAYYFPDANYDLLHEKITPVNTFRIIFRQYFGENIDLLEDNSYFSMWKTPYDFVNVTDTE